MMAPLDPKWVDPGGWTLDDGCYVRLQLYFVRVGFLPQWDPEKPFVPAIVRNTSTVYDELEGTVAYLDKLESSDFDYDVISEGTYVRPPMSNGLLAVVKEVERARFDRDGTPYKVRPCTDHTGSGVNPCLKRWPFRMQGHSSAVRMFQGDSAEAAQGSTRSAGRCLSRRRRHGLVRCGFAGCGRWVRRGQDGGGSDGFCPAHVEYLATTDLSKYYLSFGLHPDFQPFTWFSDVRREHKWRGTGEPTKLWFDCLRKRRRQNAGPWRYWKVCNFGLSPMVAYASALSGEVVQAFHAWVVDGQPAGHTVAYIDDNLLRARGKAAEM